MNTADPYVWGGQTKKQLAKRNKTIRELAAMGRPRKNIARVFNLTPSRVGQIIRGAGR